MKDRLEEFVEKHRQEFDLFEPRAEMWSKIEPNLKGNQPHRISAFLWKAAAVILVFGFSFWAQRQIEQKPASSGIRIAKTVPSETAERKISEARQAMGNKVARQLPELNETELYYSRKVKNSMKELNVYLTAYPEVAADIKKELADLDSVYNSLKKDLGDNVANSEIIDAMIQNYRMKLQLLEDIKKELGQQNAPKQNRKRSSYDL